MTSVSQHLNRSSQRIDCRFAQLCFTVENLDEALPQFSAMFGAGPWFILPEIPAHMDRTTYRGVPTPLGARIALGYSGDLMYELVCPRPDSRSIFKEWADRYGFGLHHFGFLVTDFNATIDAIDTSGLERLTTSTTPRGARVVMVQGREPLGVIEEYIELIPSSENFYAFMRLEAMRWDRRELVFSQALPSFD
ncbi:VOC family protein [Paraburkholderia sediminicola]|uniref:VOC family protein n=1 Tax=Paraburkholderia sediminicola TaxID=458836 RepID=UPI0038BB511C